MKNNEGKLISIVILEDEYLARDGLALNLNSQDDITVLGEFGEVKPFLKSLKDTQPNIVTIDLKIDASYKSSFDAIQKIKEQYPEIMILVITSFSEVPNFVRCLQLEVDGFIVKVNTTNEYPTVSDVVRMLARGQKYYDPNTVSKLGSYISIPPNDKFGIKGDNFTNREKDVMKLLSQDLSDQEIAQQLRIAEATVKTHNQRIYSKLNVSNRRDARNIIIYNKLVPNDSESRLNGDNNTN